MFTETATSHLLTLIARAHQTFILPLVSQSRNRDGYIKFSVDNSPRYKVGSLGMLLFDICAFFAILTSAYTAHKWRDEFSISFRLLTIYLDIPILLNIILDIHSMLRNEQLAELLNFGQEFYYSFTSKVPLFMNVLLVKKMTAASF